MEWKKAYYYIICLAALFVVFWGAVDLASSTIGLTIVKSPSISVPAYSSSPDSPGEQSLDVYYQKRMLLDRLTDSLARIIIAGAVFAFCRLKVRRLEKGK